MLNSFSFFFWPSMISSTYRNSSQAKIERMPSKQRLTNNQISLIYGFHIDILLMQRGFLGFSVTYLCCCLAGSSPGQIWLVAAETQSTGPHRRQPTPPSPPQRQPQSSPPGAHVQNPLIFLARYCVLPWANRQQQQTPHSVFID